MVPFICDQALPPRAVALMYHDVIADGDWSASGFSGGPADLYKLELSRFRSHLDAIDCVIRAGTALPLLLTFDDGGVSAHTLIAPELERLGWRGHFFITTGYIGRPGFLTAGQIRDLHVRGHVIGSHSSSHPPRMSSCTTDELRHEWTQSVRVLAEIVGQRIRCASVPGGFHSREVARAAAEAGIRVLFTSEPSTKSRAEEGCRTLGRYFLQRHTPASAAAAFAAGRLMPRARQAVLWQIKKAVKKVGGNAWFRFREWALASKKRVA